MINKQPKNPIKCTTARPDANEANDAAPSVPKRTQNSARSSQKPTSISQLVKRELLKISLTGNLEPRKQESTKDSAMRFSNQAEKNCSVRTPHQSAAAGASERLLTKEIQNSSDPRVLDKGKSDLPKKSSSKEKFGIQAKCAKATNFVIDYSPDGSSTRNESKAVCYKEPAFQKRSVSEEPRINPIKSKAINTNSSTRAKATDIYFPPAIPPFQCPGLYSLLAKDMSPNSTSIPPPSFHQPTFQRLYALILDTYDAFFKPDLEIRVCGHAFFVHREILQAFSDLPRLQNLPKAVKVKWEGATAEAFEIMYGWMKCRESSVPKELLIPVLKMVHFFKIMDLEKQCYIYVDAHNHLTGKSQAPPLHFKCPSLGLQSICMQLLNRSVGARFLSMVAMSEFKKLNLQELTTLLSQNGIAVHTEKEVVAAAIHWLTANWHIRKHDVSEVMRHVHHRNITDFFLRSAKSKSLIHEIVNHSEFEAVRNFSKQYEPNKSRRCVSNKHAKAYHRGEGEGVQDFYYGFVKYLNTLRTEMRELGKNK